MVEKRFILAQYKRLCLIEQLLGRERNWFEKINFFEKTICNYHFRPLLLHPQTTGTAKWWNW
ncbi:MAG TPA: hypothetical protein DCR35_02760 [Runella sp.]|nr:hypothetical protein [Runella sp.]